MLMVVCKYLLNRTYQNYDLYLILIRIEFSIIKYIICIIYLLEIPRTMLVLGRGHSTCSRCPKKLTILNFFLNNKNKRVWSINPQNLVNLSWLVHIFFLITKFGHALVDTRYTFYYDVQFSEFLHSFSRSWSLMVQYSYHIVQFTESFLDQ